MVLFVYFSGRGNEKEKRESHQLAEHRNLNQRKNNNNNKLIAGKIAEGEKSSAITSKQKKSDRKENRQIQSNCQNILSI